MNTAYALTPHDLPLGEESIASLWLHDLATNPDDLHIEALAASGDYFELLATTLDQVSDTMPAASAEYYRLQYAVRTLLYLQRHYNIVKKH